MLREGGLGALLCALLKGRCKDGEAGVEGGCSRNGNLCRSSPRVFGRKKQPGEELGFRAVCPNPCLPPLCSGMEGSGCLQRILLQPCMGLTVHPTSLVPASSWSSLSAGIGSRELQGEEAAPAGPHLIQGCMGWL